MQALAECSSDPAKSGVYFHTSNTANLTFTVKKRAAGEDVEKPFTKKHHTNAPITPPPPAAPISTFPAAVTPSQLSIPQRQIQNQLWIWEQLIHREQNLLEQMKTLCSNPPASESIDSKYQSMQQDLRSFFEHKMKVLLPFMDSVNSIAPEIPTSLASASEEPIPANLPTLEISQQPMDIIIANRYIVPAPSIVVSIPWNYHAIPKPNTDRSNNATLVLCASLYYHLSDKEVVKTMDGKQDILQGVKRISIDVNIMSQHKSSSPNLTTVITFSKLKILEVSSKHKHQPFSIVFAIEEYTKGSKRIIASTKSTSFQVLSRPTSTAYGNNAAVVFHQGTVSKREEKSAFPEENKAEGHDGTLSTAVACCDGNNMILQDITELLTLPQKEAALKLGISESMLCKRFKESTRRKWPYRYLRKLEKVIKMLVVQDNDSCCASKEDREKLERLVKEKEECLRPVKIRITANDRIMSLNSQGSTSMGKTQGSPVAKEEAEKLTETTSSLTASGSISSTGDSSNEEEDEDTQDEDQFVLETLKLLKSQRP